MNIDVTVWNIRKTANLMQVSHNPSCRAIFENQLLVVKAGESRAIPSTDVCQTLPTDLCDRRIRDCTTPAENQHALESGLDSTKTGNLGP